ncbi:MULTISPECIES: BadF/BadG/BcrA/BcrD ATPase family protein [unclassified Rhizobium]|uniref:N-acetylglucosamine kinase n=1 Tax=unclassified Rhizobium TaxID=2613769 RepID=UPI000EA8DFCC|nr:MULTISPECIES: BadF/BadG/BcrA/BcrD ATPase family protein [unclassified Rhizobium]AYG69964.1 N-acetylglucosamine kinase [Rhizobium sp. CCGE531]AYG76340.1 N-acetylglucosamine kinase [Rhizobium sp. CCGE532]
MSGDLILGIDGGGSKVLVALADRTGNVLRMSRSGGVNPMDNPNWRHELALSLRPFLEQQQPAAVAAALPAYGEVARLSEQQREAIESSFPEAQRHILNDVDAAHLGAFAARPGILVLSGTGSMAWARNSAGVSARVGGWGDVIGDEGSSYWIGRAALSLVSQSLDGRAAPTALAKAMFEFLALDSFDPVNALGGWVSELENPRADIAALSVLVDRVARTGDSAAKQLIEQAASELAKHVEAIAPHCDPAADWTYAGGTFASRALLAALERRIGRPAAIPMLPPIGGALLAAARLLDWPVDDGWITQIAATAKTAMAHSGECRPQ